MTLTRISSLDLGYQAGQLSLFPLAVDTPGQLYHATNNSVTTLKQTLTYNGKYIVVNDNAGFPANGLLTIGPPPGQPGTNYELVYYDQKIQGVFRNIIRGFAGSRQGQWSAGSHVTNAVMAEHHNAIKDAILQLQGDMGLIARPDAASLNGILKAQEVRFLSPKPLYRAWPLKGPPPLRVRFQNFSSGPVIRSLWDFGDGSTSVEKSPIHIFQTEGVYSVKLNIITSLGAQGIATKSNYITVDESQRTPFFYVTPVSGYSRQTAASHGVQPTTFKFIDQTDGDILQRYWIFDGNGTSGGVEVGNQSLAVNDPDAHSTSFVYESPGSYEPSLLVVLTNQKLQRAFLKDIITVV